MQDSSVLGVGYCSLALSHRSNVGGYSSNYDDDAQRNVTNSSKIYPNTIVNMYIIFKKNAHILQYMLFCFKRNDAICTPSPSRWQIWFQMPVLNLHQDAGFFRALLLRTETTWHGSVFRIMGPLWGKSNGHRCIPQEKGLQCLSLVVSFLIAGTSLRSNSRVACEMRRLNGHATSPYWVSTYIPKICTRFALWCLSLRFVVIPNQTYNLYE